MDIGDDNHQLPDKQVATKAHKMLHAPWFLVLLNFFKKTIILNLESIYIYIYIYIYIHISICFGTNHGSECKFGLDRCDVGCC